MFNWIDIIIIAILLLGILVGTWRGFMIGLLSMFGSFINLILSIVLCKPTANLLMKWTNWDNKLFDAISAKFSSISSSFNTNMVGMEADELKSHIATALSSNGIFKPFQWFFKSIITITPADIADKTSITLNQVLSQTLTICTFIVAMFVFFTILFFIIYHLLRKYIAKFKEKHIKVKSVDRCLGSLLGGTKALFSIMVIFAFISLFRNSAVLAPILNTISSSAIGGPLSTWTYGLIDKYFDFKKIFSTVSNLV